MKRFSTSTPPSRPSSQVRELRPVGLRPNSRRCAIGAVVLIAASLSTDMAAADAPGHPFDFFEGTTETDGILKVVMRSPVHTRSVGRGEVEPDGSFSLVQRVEDQGREPYMRRWTVKQVAPRQFTGTMTEATGPVTIDEIGTRFRFRFRMNGSLSVEEWLTPLPGGRSAKNQLTVRKFGFPVASAEGMVRKISKPRLGRSLPHTPL